MSLRRLSRVELTRYRSRRAVVVLMLLTLVATAFIAFALIKDTAPPDQADVARAERLVERETNQPYTQRELQRCLETRGFYDRPRFTDLSPLELQERCERNVLPRLEWFLYSPELRPGQEIRNTSLAVAGLAILAVMLGATTFAGADWNTGSITNQLLATPSRRRLWGAKALVVTAASGVFVLVAMAGWWLAILAAASARDIFVGPDAMVDIWTHVLRGGILGAVAGLGAYALTMLLRSTVAALAVLAAYAIIGDFLLNVLPIADAERVAITTNALAWLQGTFEYYSYERCADGARYVGGTGCQVNVLVTQLDGGVFLALLLAVVVAASLVGFSRRDV